MKKIFAVLITSFAAFSGFGQSTAAWETIYIKDLGQIKMPPTLEVQAGSYKSEVASANNDPSRREYRSDHLVFQQKGLNDRKMDAYNTYVRVTISTDRGEAGTYGSFKKKIGLTAEDIKDWDAALMEEVNRDLTSGSRIVKWFGGKETVVNGMHCYAYSFQRQLDDKPVVQVEGYLFHDDDRMHTLVISYRASQAEKWEGVLEEMRCTFKIER